MRKKIMITLLTGCIALVTLSSQAQQKGARKPASRGLTPVFKSSLNNVLSNTLPASVMKKLLDSTLLSRDRQGDLHPVVSFDFGYQTRDSYLNDTTGRPETSKIYFSFHFNSNKLDSVWRTRVIEKIRPGDEVFFDHIIATDKKGVQYLSSPLHFIIE